MTKHKIKLEDEKALLKYKDSENEYVFKEIIKVDIVSHVNNKSSRLNIVLVPKKLFQSLGEICVLFNSLTNEYEEVFLKTDSELHGHGIKVSPTILNKFSDTEDGGFYLIKYNAIKVNKVYKQYIENIKEDNVVLSSQYEEYFENVECSLFMISNTVTGENIVVKRRHINFDKKLNSNSIRINRNQRIFLGLELGDYIPDPLFEKLNKNKKIQKEEWTIIYKVYDKKTHRLIEDSLYQDRIEAKKIINRYLEPSIFITPIISSYLKKVHRTPIRAICDFYVGKSTLSLSSRRPYDMDEGGDIVRISKNNMALLGVSEMDRVILTYHNKSKKCRVLLLENNDSFKKNNIPVSIDISIAIPVNVRNELGIMDIGSSVKVDRDTGFIFRKSINEQIVPILLTLFSSNFLTNFSVWKTAIVSLLLSPIVIYFNLSSKRNMRLK